MAEIELEIESRLKRISKNETQIAAILKQLWTTDNPKEQEKLRQDELDMRQQNVTLRREVADLRTKQAR